MGIDLRYRISEGRVQIARSVLSGKSFVFGDRGAFVPKGFDEGVRRWDARRQEEG
jgi:hypothetical protein